MSIYNECRASIAFVTPKNKTFLRSKRFAVLAASFSSFNPQPKEARTSPNIG
jgi:hypothetical protein